MERNTGKGEIIKLPLCRDQYLNYTVESYTSCCKALNDESIERFSSFFERLKTSELREKNKYVDGSINSGYELSEKEERPRVNEEASRQLMFSINELASNEKPKSKREILIMKSMLSLVSSMAYLNVEEVFALNNIFANVQLFGHDLLGPYEDFYYTKKKRER